MRKTLLALAALGLGFTIAGGASAATTGTLIFDTTGNDPFGGNLTNADLGGYDDMAIDSPSLYKCDFAFNGDAFCTGDDDDAVEGIAGTNGNVPGEQYADGDFTITFDTLKPGENDEYIAGTWSFAPNDGETKAPLIVAMKAGTDLGYFLLAPGTTSGNWDVRDFSDQTFALSHISFYDTEVNGVIPLPAAGWMLISAMGGLGVLARRRRAA